MQLAIQHPGFGAQQQAVHRAYAKRALIKIPSVEDYEEPAAAKVESAACQPTHGRCRCLTATSQTALSGAGFLASR